MFACVSPSVPVPGSNVSTSSGLEQSSGALIGNGAKFADSSIDTRSTPSIIKCYPMTILLLVKVLYYIKTTLHKNPTYGNMHGREGKSILWKSYMYTYLYVHTVRYGHSYA